MECLLRSALPYSVGHMVAVDGGVKSALMFTALDVDVKGIDLSVDEARGFLESFLSEEFEAHFLGVVAERLDNHILALPRLAGSRRARLQGQELYYFGL